MNSFIPVLYSALLGLLAGASHGVLSHQADLPLSLTEQFLTPLQISSIPE
ncbi:hypothetical protein [Acaryochloris thomasi]|nr:hypothetical protein [Acaryochloris thomasi]